MILCTFIYTNNKKNNLNKYLNDLPETVLVDTDTRKTYRNNPYSFGSTRCLIYVK